MPERVQDLARKLRALFEEHGVTGIADLIGAYRTNTPFRDRWDCLWSNFTKAEGGKVGGGTVAAVLGFSLGGVGIAAMGGAIGLPLFAILGLAGVVGGAELDGWRRCRGTTKLALRLPNKVHGALVAEANQRNLSLEEHVYAMLLASLGAALDGADA